MAPRPEAVNLCKAGRARRAPLPLTPNRWGSLSSTHPTCCDRAVSDRTIHSLAMHREKDSFLPPGVGGVFSALNAPPDEWKPPIRPRPPGRCASDARTNWPNRRQSAQLQANWATANTTRQGHKAQGCMRRGIEQLRQQPPDNCHGEHRQDGHRPPEAFRPAASIPAALRALKVNTVGLSREQRVAPIETPKLKLKV